MICAGTLLREDWKPFGRRKASFLCESMDGNEVAGSILFLSGMDACLFSLSSSVPGQAAEETALRTCGVRGKEALRGTK